MPAEDSEDGRRVLGLGISVVCTRLFFDRGRETESSESSVRSVVRAWGESRFPDLRRRTARCNPDVELQSSCEEKDDVVPNEDDLAPLFPWRLLNKSLYPACLRFLRTIRSP